jgi:hypothetical protein
LPIVYQGDRHRHTDRGRDEVLHRQRRHLGQVTHGGLAGVGLPVGVGDEADRGVPGDVVGDRLHVQAQRQPVLQALKAVHDQDGDH